MQQINDSRTLGRTSRGILMGKGFSRNLENTLHTTWSCMFYSGAVCVCVCVGGGGGGLKLLNFWCDSPKPTLITYIEYLYLK